MKYFASTKINWMLCIIFFFAKSHTNPIAANIIASLPKTHARSTDDKPAKATPTDTQDITFFSCLWAMGRTCPDANITFHLYTRYNPKKSQCIYMGNSLNISNITHSFYDNRHPSKIIIHGYNANMFLFPLQKLKDEYLAKDEYNIIFVDWSTLALGPCYINAVHNIRHTGECIAQLVERIRDLGSSDIHLIGFSLGAQVSNYVASSLKNFSIPRITGLDPSLPLFITNDNSEKLDKSDAIFVDVIHTNAFIQGKYERCGHVDFYMNGGVFQPNCFKNNILDIFSCSHHRAIDYYHESIRSEQGFWGWPCSSYGSYLRGLCPSPGSVLVKAGDNVNITTRGMFFINTNGKSPFAMGH